MVLGEVPWIKEPYDAVRGVLHKRLLEQDPDPEIVPGLERLCLTSICAAFNVHDDDEFTVTKLVMHAVHNTPYRYSCWLDEVERSLEGAAIEARVKTGSLAAFRALRGYLLHLSWLEEQPNFLSFLQTPAP